MGYQSYSPTRAAYPDISEIGSSIMGGLAFMASLQESASARRSEERMRNAELQAQVSKSDMELRKSLLDTAARRKNEDIDRASALLKLKTAQMDYEQRHREVQDKFRAAQEVKRRIEFERSPTSRALLSGLQPGVNDAKFLFNYATLNNNTSFLDVITQGTRESLDQRYEGLKKIKVTLGGVEKNAVEAATGLGSTDRAARLFAGAYFLKNGVGRRDLVPYLNDVEIKKAERLSELVDYDGTAAVSPADFKQFYMLRGRVRTYAQHEAAGRELTEDDKKARKKDEAELAAFSELIGKDKLSIYEDFLYGSEEENPVENAQTLVAGLPSERLVLGTLNKLLLAEQGKGPLSEKLKKGGLSLPEYARQEHKNLLILGAEIVKLAQQGTPDAATQMTKLLADPEVGLNTRLKLYGNKAPYFQEHIFGSTKLGARSYCEREASDQNKRLARNMLVTEGRTPTSLTELKIPGPGEDRPVISFDEAHMELARLDSDRRRLLEHAGYRPDAETLPDSFFEDKSEDGAVSWGDMWSKDDEQRYQQLVKDLSPAVVRDPVLGVFIKSSQYARAAAKSLRDSRMPTKILDEVWTGVRSHPAHVLGNRTLSDSDGATASKALSQQSSYITQDTSDLIFGNALNGTWDGGIAKSVSVPEARVLARNRAQGVFLDDDLAAPGTRAAVTVGAGATVATLGLAPGLIAVGTRADMSLLETHEAVTIPEVIPGVTTRNQLVQLGLARGALLEGAALANPNAPASSSRAAGRLAYAYDALEQYKKDLGGGDYAERKADLSLVFRVTPEDRALIETRVYDRLNSAAEEDKAFIAATRTQLKKRGKTLEDYIEFLDAALGVNSWAASTKSGVYIPMVYRDSAPGAKNVGGD